jgi:phage nucleotide-binding protein
MTNSTDPFNLEAVGSKIDRGISFIIYSDPGIGKTTMSATLPSDVTLIINTEAGLGPLLGSGHHVFNVVKACNNTGKDLEAVMSDIYLKLRTGDHPYENVVVDNLSELEQQLIHSLTTKHGKEVPELREYGEASYKMKEWLHNFRDLVFNNINVIFNAWEFPLDIRNSDGQVLTKTFPMVGKKIAPQACGIVDCVGHLEIYPKSGKRWVRFGPHDQYITKSQFKGLDMGEQPEFPYILDKLRAYDYSGDNKSGSAEDEADAQTETKSTKTKGVKDGSS